MTTEAMQAVPDDVSSWLEIVREVEDLFGPMPDFESYLRRTIERGTGLVVRDAAMVLGAAALSRDTQPHRIHWLAVRRSHRRLGVGGALLHAVLTRWPDRDIEVVTFTAHEPQGAPARRLYRRFGLTCRGRAEAAPDGGARDLFVLSR